MLNLNQVILLIALNVNTLNIPIRRQRLQDWIKKKQDSIICGLREAQYKAQFTFI